MNASDYHGPERRVWRSVQMTDQERAEEDAREAVAVEKLRMQRLFWRCYVGAIALAVLVFGWQCTGG